MGSSEFRQQIEALCPDLDRENIEDFFQRMDASIKARIYQRLYDVLSGTETSPRFAHLSATDRAAILEIVLETVPNLPDYWKRSG